MKERIEQQPVRVRFAPSPTGFLHVGGLRTALFNYLFARHYNGTFILRIEDTDQNRIVEKALENLVQTLEWSGLDYDEGPIKDGSVGPYVQSERLDIYHKHVQMLLDSGDAYYCFCTPERLETLRKQQQLAKLSTKYDGHCRHLQQSVITKEIENKTPRVVRLKVPDEDGGEKFTDLIRGDVFRAYKEIDDQVLLKSDGFPTYHLANVVDDYLMGVTHVIRGEEWLPSMPKHLLLYKYFGWKQPQFAHLPLLLNSDRSKLSKRQGDVAVEDYRDKGYLPEALLNFVALLGWNTSDDQEIFSLQELTQKFTLDGVNKAGAVFDVGKLNWMNGQYIRTLDEEDYFQRVRLTLEKSHPEFLTHPKLEKILLAVQDKLEHLNQIEEKLSVFFSEEFEFENEEAKALTQHEDSQTVYQAFLQHAESLEILDTDTFKTTMKNVQNSTGVKGKGLWMPTRVALTGKFHGPELALVVEVLGMDKCKDRMQYVLDIK